MIEQRELDRAIKHLREQLVEAWDGRVKAAEQVAAAAHEMASDASQKVTDALSKLDASLADVRTNVASEIGKMVEEVHQGRTNGLNAMSGLKKVHDDIDALRAEITKEVAAAEERIHTFLEEQRGEDGAERRELHDKIATLDGSTDERMTNLSRDLTGRMEASEEKSASAVRTVQDVMAMMSEAEEEDEPEAA